jgi:hypothetical protein
MDIDELMGSLKGLKRYMTVDEIIVTIGISRINGIIGQVELGRKVVKGTIEAISLEEGMVIDVNLKIHEELKSSNFECFLYMSVNYKRKNQCTKSTKREEINHIQEIPH